MSEGTIHITGGYLPRTDGMSILDNGIMSSNAHLRTLLSDNALSDVEKRHILASWASDRRAVVNNPSLRQLDDGTIVDLDDILDALKSLDGASVCDTLHGRLPTHRASWRWDPSTLARRVSTRIKGHRPDDDDDPPPCPVGSARPLGPYPINGRASALAEAC